MNLTQKYPILGSSADPNEISMTIKSIGAWVVVGIIAIAHSQGLSIAETDLTALVNIIATLVGCIMTGYGLIRKIYYKLV